MIPDWLQRAQGGLLGTPDNYGGLLADQELQRARQQGLQSFGASLLQASGPTRMPTSFGQALGGAVQAGQQGQQMSTQQALQNLLLKKQFEKPVQPLINVPEGGSIYDPNQQKVVFTGTPKNPAPKGLQHTDSGLTFDPATGEMKDSTGRVLSTDEIAKREADLAANKVAMTTAAQQKAKLDALPKGSMAAAVEWSLQNGGGVPPGFSRNPAQTALFWQAFQDRAAADGNTVAQQMAQSKLRGTLKPAMEQTQKQLAQNEGFLGTLDSNIKSADAFSQRVGGDSSPAINTIFNKWKRGVTGDPDVAAFDVFNTAINGEAAKIASGGVNSSQSASDTQIKHQREQLNSAQNYKQWRAAADAMLTEGHNRIDNIRAQRDSLLSQSAATTPTPAPTITPQTNAKGWLLHTDAKGNKAYVSPDGKQYEEVR